VAISGLIGFNLASPCVGSAAAVVAHRSGGRVAARENVDISSPLDRVSVAGGNIDVSGPGGQVVVRPGHITLTGPAGQVSSAGKPVNHQTAVGTSCSSAGPALPWLVIGLLIFLLIIAVCAPVLVAIRLLRQARRAPAQPTPEPAQLQPV
jgi:hypothetical protein